MSVRSSRERAHEENMWGKPATDIMNGIGNIRTVSPARGIWELVQNARDVVRPGERAEIIFTRYADCMTFQHDGLPFTWKTLEALILQTSSKSDMDAAQVGQYGTGFLTTHKFGLRFLLSAPLKIEDDKEWYHNIVDFEIDRSATNKEAMREAIKKQWNKTEEWEKTEQQTDSPARYTVFKYLCMKDVERENVKVAFASSPSLIPYVLLLNDRIRSITLDDHVCGVKSIFERQSQDWLLECNLEKGNVYYTCINDKRYYVIRSHEAAHKDKNMLRVVIILPLEQDLEDFRSFNFPEETPQLYINLPLLGTSHWGLNFLMHSPDFTCDTEKRDNLRFVGNGQNDDSQVTDNKSVIDLGRELIFEFIDHNLLRIKNTKYLVRCNFKIKQSDDQLGEYYRQLRQQFRDKYKTLAIVRQSNQSMAKPAEIRVLDENLSKACTDKTLGGNELLSAVYKLLDHHKEIAIPEENEMLFWSNTINGWYKDEENPQKITVDQLAELVSQTAVNAEDISWLFVICRYIVKVQRTDLFGTYKIVPNEKYELCFLKPLLNPKVFPLTVKAALSLMVPEKVVLFVHPSFAKLFPEMEAYSDNEAKKDLSASISQHNEEEARARESFKNKVISMQYENVDASAYNKSLYYDGTVECIAKLYEALLPEESKSFMANTLKLLFEFYGLTPTENVNHLNSDVFDVRACCTTLLHDALFKFSLLQDKSGKADWCKRMVENVYASSESRSMLNNYQIYPDQTGQFKYAESLQKQPKGLLNRIVELYDEIVQPQVKLECNLVSKDYCLDFVGNGNLAVSEICGAIEKVVKDRNYSITDYEKQKQIVEIIQNLSSEDEVASIWKGMFGDIDAHKGQLMFSIIKSQSKRDSIFQIMKVDDDIRLKKIAELSKRDDLDELIRLGEEAVERKRNEMNDFAYKKMLGEYVEEYLFKEVGGQLQETKVCIDDEQGGQDLIIRKKGEPVYYIEVKSRWRNDVSVLMSTLQYQRSIENEDRYALTCVDMFGFDRSLIGKHEYPSLEEILPRIRVIENIGYLNKGLVKQVQNESKDPHVNPGYQILVPQDLIKGDESETFDVFLQRLVEKVKDL